MIKTTKMLLEEYSNYSNPADKIMRLVKSGELFSLTKGLYETDRSVAGHYLAGSICSPSYLSFEFALSYYGLIPEKVFAFTSATFGRNKRKEITNIFGRYVYCDTPKAVYPLGINVVEENGYCYFIATPEKAICDQLYSMSPLLSLGALSAVLTEDLRIEVKELDKLNREDITILSQKYASSNVRLLLAYLMRL